MHIMYYLITFLSGIILTQVAILENNPEATLFSYLFCILALVLLAANIQSDDLSPKKLIRQFCVLLNFFLLGHSAFWIYYRLYIAKNSTSLHFWIIVEIFVLAAICKNLSESRTLKETES